MCYMDPKKPVHPEILTARQKDLAKRYWKLLDQILKVVPKG